LKLALDVPVLPPDFPAEAMQLRETDPLLSMNLAF